MIIYIPGTQCFGFFKNIQRICRKVQSRQEMRLICGTVIFCGRLTCFRDLIAYRIVISVPRCHLAHEEDREQEEISHLYRIANALPSFLKERGFSPEAAGGVKESTSDLLTDEVRLFYRDYIVNASENGYRSLHITFFDEIAGCYMEMQLRTKDMDDIAEIGAANHLGYERQQEYVRGRRDTLAHDTKVHYYLFSKSRFTKGCIEKAGDCNK